MRRQVRTYDQWLQGSSGASDPAKGEYNSENAQVYENGTLGPRPGWKEIVDSNGTRVHNGTDDILKGFGWYRETDDAENLVIIFRDTSDSSDRKYDVLPLATDTWAAGGSVADLAGVSSLSPPEHDDVVKYQVWNDGFLLTALGSYLSVSDASSIGTPTTPQIALTHVTAGTSTTVFDVADTAGLSVGSVIDIYDSAGTLQDNAKTISDITGKTITIDAASGTPSVDDLIAIDGTSLNPDGRSNCVTIYRERAYYWGFNTQPGRVYYSEPADYKHVSSLSFFDVNVKSDEYAGAVTGMWSVKNALMIARSDDRWMVLTGTSPENGTLRELGRDPVPDYLSATVIDNEVYFLHRDGHGVAIATPSFIDHDQLGHLSALAYPDSTEVRPNNNFLPQTAVGDEVGHNMFLPGRKISNDATLVAVERANGVFTLSRWALNAGTVEDVNFTNGRPNEMYAIVDTTSSWVPYSRNFTLNRPSKSNDTKSVALGSEDGTASGSEVIVDLGEVVAGQGRIVRPVKVVIDLDYWKGGNYSAPELAVDATIMGTEAATPEDVLTTQTISTTAWSNSVGNAPYKRRVSVALPQGQFGTRFKVRLTYDNLALDNVQVYYDEQDDPR